MQQCWIVTPPDFFPDEAAYINALFSAGLPTLLLRKPRWETDAFAQLLRGINPAYHPRIVIGGQPDLVGAFGLAGLHMSEAFRAACTPAVLAQYSQRGQWISTSVHQSVPEGLNSRFLLLGPVFDSISKPGYAGTLPPVIPANAIAIGGVQARNLAQVKAMGFCGAALLGCIWQAEVPPVEAFLAVKEMFEALNGFHLDG